MNTCAKSENKGFTLGRPPASRPKLTQNTLCKPQAAEVGLAFEAIESFADDDLNGCHFIVSQLLKFVFAPLAA